jgi:hypothetical protein
LSRVSRVFAAGERVTVDAPERIAEGGVQDDAAAAVALHGKLGFESPTAVSGGGAEQVEEGLADGSFAGDVVLIELVKGGVIRLDEFVSWLEARLLRARHGEVLQKARREGQRKVTKIEVRTPKEIRIAKSEGRIPRSVSDLFEDLASMSFDLPSNRAAFPRGTRFCHRVWLSRSCRRSQDESRPMKTGRPSAQEPGNPALVTC